MAKLPGWKRVFIADHPLQAATMATALEAEGLTPQLRGMELWGVAVEILFSEGAAPSVWVPAVQEAQALQIVATMQSQPSRKLPDWFCTSCHEKVPASFETCWKCGAESPLINTGKETNSIPQTPDQEAGTVVAGETSASAADATVICRQPIRKGEE